MVANQIVQTIQLSTIYSSNKQKFSIQMFAIQITTVIAKSKNLSLVLRMWNNASIRTSLSSKIGYEILRMLARQVFI